jgi:hypothetical protein
MSIRILMLVCAALSVLLGQINTGTVVGIATDPQGLVIAGAQVTLTSETTGDVRRTVSNQSGTFTFPAVPAGTYTLRVSMNGFQTFERKGMALTSSEYLNAGTIMLNVGSTAETVSVEASAAVVQTASAENSAVLNTRQVSQILARGRDITTLLRLLPGVQQTADSATLGGRIGSSTPSIAGLRNRDNTVTLDGQVSSDADNTNVHISAVSLDAVEEVKVVTNGYQAEYGRNAGAQINIVSRSGTREFHGSASWFKRHEQFNANNFFNNQNGLPKPLYRHNTWVGTLGGPLFIPRLLNTGRDKLFFFFGHEEWRSFEPQGVQRRTMPTALERRGDFSQSVDVSGRVIQINDPLTGAPFPGNVIPANRINPLGQSLLNVFNQPNFLDRSISGGNYNYQFQDIWRLPKRLSQLKVDYNATASDRITGRWRKWRQETLGYTEPTNFGNSQWDLYYAQYMKTEDAGVLNYTRSITPALVNEFSFSYRQMGELGEPTSAENLSRVTREGRGLTGLRQLYPAANPLGVIPALTFGGIPNTASVAYDARFPMVGGDRRWSLADNASWSKRSHLLKAGFYYEYNLSDEGFSAPCFSGCFDFSVDVNNPLDTRHTYANALLGVFRSYSESSRKNFRGGENWLLEWFAQDSWKVKRNLTLELGMRFSLFSPWKALANERGAAWVMERYDPSRAVRYYAPAFDAQRRRVAQNPITGELAPAVLIGAIVPGSGDPLNGMVTSDDAYFSEGWHKRPSVQLGPRFGFAWDVFGNGKTAVRGAFGITKQTQARSGIYVTDTSAVPPVVQQSTIFYSSLENLSSSAGAAFPPGGVRSFERDPRVPSVYNYSFGIQQDIGYSTVFGVAYVGNVARHLMQTRNLNTLPYGARFQPENADPTNPSRPLSDPFFVRFRGYQAINAVEYSGISNYNSLQATLNRRLRSGLQFGAAYTWSKAMNLTDDANNLPMHRSAREFLYGKAGYDQTHILVVNYVWDLPRVGRLWNNRVASGIFDNWQLAGFTTFASGTPSGIGYSTTDNAEITGGGDGARIVVTGKAQLPRGERDFYRWFDTSVFARPARGDWGNAPKDVIRLPGTHNWDVSLFKNIPLGSESRILQFRSEFYNVLNQTQFSGVDTAARFDPAGRQVNTRFGQVISAREARVIQFALTLRF